MLAWIGPGVLVAATGVGAGDLATAAFAGAQLGLAVLWAVVVGALAKFVLNEQLARWQLATGTTILEGAVARLGPIAWAIFGAYLVFWSPFVAVALMKACGAVLHAMVPAVPPRAGAIASSLIGLAMVWIGGFALFQRVMAACVAAMFAVVVISAAVGLPDPRAVLAGLIPSLPTDRQALGWTVALMGGVGGTLTIICYGYWLREAGRDAPASLRTVRLDLALAYAMTAIFGLAMVVLASGLYQSQADALQGSGASIVVQVADRIGQRTHPALRWAFLVGALGAVFSSLLGVWQSVPSVFADWLSMRPGRAKPGVDADGHLREATDAHAPAYRAYLLALAILPMALLYVRFQTAQRLYGIVGAAFVPLLAVALAVMMNRPRWLQARAGSVAGGGRQERPAMANGWLANLALFAALALSAIAGAWSVLGG